MTPSDNTPTPDCQDPRCGQPHITRRGTQACVGHVDDEDGSIRPCQLPPMLGGRVCGSHGGRAPQVRAKADRVVAAQAVGVRVVAKLAELGEDLPDVDPLGKLAKSLSLASVMVGVLRCTLAEERELYGPDHLGDARSHVLVRELERWNRQQADIAKLNLDAGVQSAQLDINQQTADTFMRIVGMVIARLPESERPAALDLVRAELLGGA